MLHHPLVGTLGCFDKHFWEIFSIIDHPALSFFLPKNADFSSFCVRFANFSSSPPVDSN